MEVPADGNDVFGGEVGVGVGVDLSDELVWHAAPYALRRAGHQRRVR